MNKINQMEKIKFCKYEGLGNDFIIIDCRNNLIPKNIFKIILTNAKALCNRNFGIGADGVIFVLDSKNNCDVRMKIINSDGSEAEMCGNGIRCLIKFLVANEYSTVDSDSTINVETQAGIIQAKHQINGQIMVNMGKPIFNPINIPTKLLVGSNGLPQANISLFEKNIDIYSVGMGNPHLITYVNDLDSVDLVKWGNYLENHNLFPAKTNVHFVKIKHRNKLEVLVWERGCGETYACGTGACATVVASNKLGLCDRLVSVVLKGGELYINWEGNKTDVYMTGDARYVFSGTTNIKQFL
tara:strand:- start:2434 stop:3327 length:894 start_codon:yes stop_codon:yes gene_type:complete